MIDEKEMKKMKKKKGFFFRIWFLFKKVYRTESWEIRKEFMVPALFEKMIRKVIGVYAVAMTGSQGAMLLGYRFNVSF